MSNPNFTTPGNMPGIDIAVLRHQADDLFGAFQETDMQFNIGGIEGFPKRGLDLIEDASGDRYFITGPSDAQAEDLVMRRFGDVAILEPVGADEGINVYGVSDGARLLIKTFRQAPYGEQYMQRLAFRTGRFMQAIHRLDRGMFGIGIEDLAITALDEGEESDEDDILLTIVPPLEAPNSAAPLSYSDLLQQGIPHMTNQDTLEAYRRGLNGETRYAAD